MVVELPRQNADRFLHSCLTTGTKPWLKARPIKQAQAPSAIARKIS